MSSMTSTAKLSLVEEQSACNNTTASPQPGYHDIQQFGRIIYYFKFGKACHSTCIIVLDLHLNHDVATMSSPCFPGAPTPDLSVRVWPRQQLELQASFTRFRSGMLCHSLTAEKYRKIKKDSI